ncbi:MAG TPA: mycofactocin-coupled SDR family oxidoreductase [Acidimicrobiales bacterium]|jgi:SDR family mycofactocin-dependent oxidoreductase|nr:mycofactocin-coupled SDR family oxidoreductase [Acidimicrobiales bacterium]
MGRVEGKVAFITGAARGQGRSHAIRLAEEGADIIAVDICEDVASATYAMSTADELAETAKHVEAAGRRAVTFTADVRDQEALHRAATEGASELGKIDVVVANAGICTLQPWDEVTPEVWKEVTDINLTGVWNTCFVTAPHVIAAGGGAMILISSTAGLKGQPFLAPYVAAKHGVVGIMRVLANELAEHHIRVNTVHPTGVDTPLLEAMYSMNSLLDAHPDLAPIFSNTLPVEVLEPRDISSTVLHLASDEAKYITGVTLSVDAGANVR